MNRTKIILGTSALVLTVAGAFAKMHKSTAANLYYTTAAGTPSSHCKLLAASTTISQFTTGAGSNQAKILTNGGGASRLLFSTAGCGSQRKVYFKP